MRRTVMLIDVHGHVTAPDKLYAYKAGLLTHSGVHGRGRSGVTKEQVVEALNAAHTSFCKISRLDRRKAGARCDGPGHRQWRAGHPFPARAWVPGVQLIGRGTRHPKDDVGRVGTPVAFDGVAFHRGDVVATDADGVIVLPGAEAAAVVLRGLARETAEAHCPRCIANGELTLDINGFCPPVRTEAT
jgi:hypothetical protein